MTVTQSLLAEYVRTGSDTAFRELVTRYVDLVYSTALRLMDGDTHRAEDVAQTVFVDLARQAQALSPDAMLGGWLHRHTCFVAANMKRSERRRQFREKEAMEMNALHNDSGWDFSLVAPILDETINQLGEEDRLAILLRFFEQRDFHSVGEALGSNEDAARMRVTRALEKLHLLLKRRGISTGAMVLGLALSTNAVQSAPVGLAAAISTAAIISGTAISTSTTVAATKVIAMTALQKTIIGAVIVTAVGTGIFEAHQASHSRKQNQTLQQQQSALTGQIRQLQRERDDATNQLVGLLAENAQLQSSSNEIELLRLRGEVGVLRAQLANAKSLAANRNLTAPASTQASDGGLNQAMLDFLGNPVPPPPNLDVAYTKEGLTGALQNAAQAVYIPLKKLEVDDSEFPPLVGIEVENESDMQKLKDEIKRLKKYKYTGSISSHTEAVMNLIPYTAYPPEWRNRIHNRVQLREQMLYYKMESGK